MNNQLIEPPLVPWLLVLTGAITLLLLVLAQFVILIKPDSQLARNLLVGKNEQWRDKTRFRSAYGCAWADRLIMLPLAVVGSIAALQGYPWG